MRMQNITIGFPPELLARCRAIADEKGMINWRTRTYGDVIREATARFVAEHDASRKAPTSPATPAKKKNGRARR